VDRHRFVACLLAVATALPIAGSQKLAESADVVERRANVASEGTRLAIESFEARLPR